MGIPDLKAIRDRDAWRAEVYDPAVAKGGERRESFATSSVEVDPLYAPNGEIDDDYLSSMGFPGQYPFTRGVQPTMYRGRLWTMRQYAGFGTALETNRKFRALLEMGQTGLSVAFDLPTQLGYDSDDPLARDEVGQVGVAIDSLADFETVFEEIPLDQISTSMTINAPASVLLAMYVAIGEAQGVARTDLRGTVQNDVLKEYVARGTYIFPPGPSLRLATDVMEFCAREVPRFNAISVSGYHIRDAGSTAAQEMGLTLSNAIAYVDSALARGLEVDDFAGNISWIFNTHNDFFEEVAKFRALRRMWARIMRERFGATNPRSWMLRTHTQTGGSTLTAQQPENNIARTAVQALAAVLGGVQSMALSCYDEALALPTDAAQRTALRTQQIIARSRSCGGWRIWGARSARSRRVTCRPRSRRRRRATSARSTPVSASWSASTRFRRATRGERRRSSGWTRRWRRRSAAGCQSSASSATISRRRRPWRRSGRPPPASTT